MARAMACSPKSPTCAIAKLARGLDSRESSHRKPYSKSLRDWPLYVWPPPRPRRTRLHIECTARSIKQLRLLRAPELQEKFGSNNLQFSDVGGRTVAELKMNKGATARLLVQDARIMSYKCRLWHGSVEEFLYTDVSDSDFSSSVDTDGTSDHFSISGGLAPSLASPLPPCPSLIDNNWFVQSVEINPDELIQVTLRCVNENQAGVHFVLENIITLTDYLLASALMLTNKDREPLIFTGSVSTHLAIRATQAICCAGLDGCDYYSPSEAALKVAQASMMKNSVFGKLRKLVLSFQPDESNQKATTENANNINQSQGNSDEGESHWFTEKPGVLVVPTNGLHKIYSKPPSSIRVTDQGSRRSLVFQSQGFENLEISSPDEDGENSFMSVGHSTILSPITLNKGESWKAAQVLLPDVR